MVKDNSPGRLTRRRSAAAGARDPATPPRPDPAARSATSHPSARGAPAPWRPHGKRDSKIAQSHCRCRSEVRLEAGRHGGQPALLRAAAARGRAQAFPGSLLAALGVQPRPLRGLLAARAGRVSRRCPTQVGTGRSYPASRPCSCGGESGLLWRHHHESPCTT